MLIKIHQTDSFRLTAFVSVIIVSSMLILMAMVYYVIKDAFHAELINNVSQDISAIQSGYNSKGESEVQEIIEQLLSNPQSRGFYLAMHLPDKKISGNLPVMPARTGTIYLKYSSGHTTHTPHHQILGMGVMLPDNLYIFAGRDSHLATQALRRMLHIFYLVLGATLIVALGGGILVSRAVLGRMDAITRTCREIMTGNMTDRIPRRKTHGEFDMLVNTINEMLDRINMLMESVQQVSNDIAHDLRTPLSRLKNRLNLALTDAETTDQYREHTKLAIYDCETILETFSALLHIGQIEAAAGNTHISDTVNLSELLEEITQIYQPEAEDVGFHLVQNIIPGVSVTGDRALLQQVFANLIENAMAYTPRGTTIRVCLMQTADTYVASVSDDGPGVSEENRKHILRRFFRCEESRSTPGSGLGLALVAAIAKYHTAKVSVEDNAPGLRISLRIPKKL